MKLKKSDTVPVMEGALLDLITRIARSRSEANFLVTRASIVLYASQEKSNQEIAELLRVPLFTRISKTLH